MNLTVQWTNILRVVEVDGLAAGGRTTTHRVATVQATQVSHYEGKLYTLSAGVSNREVNLDPITASHPGQLLWLHTDQPLDVRLNASNASMWSAVRQLMVGVAVSALFLTTVASAVTRLRVEVFGGGTVTVNDPVP